MSRSFLIIQTAFLGDAVLATALAESLHNSNNNHQISILVRKGNENLFDAHPFIKEVLVWDKTQNKTSNLFKTLAKVRVKKFDTVLNLQRFFSTGLITTLSGAASKIGFNKNPFSMFFTKSVKHEIGTGIHETERNFQLIAGIPGVVYARPRLYPSEKSVLAARSITQDNKYVVMTPASVWQTKQLPFNKWVELGKLCASKYKVVLAGAPTDSDLCKRIADEIGKEHCIISAGSLNLSGSAALMKNAVMNYVNDSGPLHIASAVNSPVKAFFCSTIPAFGFGPLSDDAQIIESQELLSCRPCGLHGKKECPINHFNCGNTITIDNNLVP